MARKPRAAKTETPPQTKYDRVAERVIAAVDELNNALVEAGEMDEMRVELVHDGNVPRRYGYRIYRLSHAVMDWKIVPEWRVKTAIVKPDEMRSPA